MPTRKYTSAIPYEEHSVAYGRFDTTRTPIDTIVIHTTVGTKQSAIDLFGSPPPLGKETSAHYMVCWDGSLVAFLEEFNTAYHCGNYALNQRSIGIEHVDNGNYDSVRPDVLYETSAKLVADICQFYSIPCSRDNIRKHNEIIATGCPHNLDIDRIVVMAQKILQPPTIDYRAKYEEASRVLYGTGTSWSKYLKLQTIITKV